MAQSIKSVLADMDATPHPATTATDEQVLAEIRGLAARGYRPSEAIVEPIRDYLSGYGILLSGDTGAGKTLLMRLLGPTIYACDHVAGYGLSNLHEWFRWTDGHEITLDDLGAERVVSEYGNRDEVMRGVIAQRAERQHARTHITTNLTAEQIAARYGDRTLSRILGMCRPHRITGPSQRVARPAKQEAT